MPAATTCRGYPYPLGTDPPDPASDIALLAIAIDADVCDMEDVLEGVVEGRLHEPGDIKATVRSTPGAGWLMLSGQTIPDADSLYPNLWAVAPANWKSGTSLVLPNMSNRVLMGGGTMGSTGGSNSFTLSTANLPAHTHTINHDHPTVNSGTQSANHTHTINHTHSASAAAAGAHAHSYPVRIGATVGNNTNVPPIAANQGTLTSTPTNSAGNHSHSISVAAYNGSSGSNNVGHYHAVNLPPFSGSSGVAGSSTPTAVTVTPNHLRINFMVKI